MTVEYLHNLKFPKFEIFYLFRFFLFLILTFFHHHHSDIFNIFHLLHVGGYLWFIRNVNNFNRFSVCLKIQDRSQIYSYTLLMFIYEQHKVFNFFDVSKQKKSQIVTVPEIRVRGHFLVKFPLNAKKVFMKFYIL